MEVPKCARPECPRSDTVIAQQTQECLTVFCRTCKLFHVRSRNWAKKRARHQIRQQRQGALASLMKEPKKIYFT